MCYMKKIVFILVTIIAIVSESFISFEIYQNEKALDKANRAYYSIKSDIDELLKIQTKAFLSSLSFGLVKEKNKTKEKLLQLQVKIDTLKAKEKKLLYYFLGVNLFILLLFFLLPKFYYVLTITINSLIMLFFGIMTPILLIVIHKNVKVLGDVVLSFESKTILGSILHLLESGNYPVGLIILLFSIVVPFIKTLTMLLILYLKEFNVAKKLLALFKHLGKWSMLDVFVVALLLVYIGAGSSQNSYSQILSGTYLFASYVIFSIISSIIVEKMLSSN